MRPPRQNRLSCKAQCFILNSRNEADGVLHSSSASPSSGRYLPVLTRFAWKPSLPISSRNCTSLPSANCSKLLLARLSR